MKCIDINEVVDYMLSLDLTNFIEERVLVKGSWYVYTSIIRVTGDRTMIRCIPNQTLSGGRAFYDGRTIYAPIDYSSSISPSTPQRTYYGYGQQTSRVSYQHSNEPTVPQAVTDEVNRLATTWAGEYR